MKKICCVLFLLGLLCLGFTSVSNASLFYVWTDTTRDGFKDLLLGSINGYEGVISGKNNYNYYSHSAHPVNGPDPFPLRLQMFVYEKTNNGRDFLHIMGGKDDAGRNRWYDFAMEIDILGSTRDPYTVRGDEGKEFLESSEDHFEGDWSFKKNTDGGVVGGLKGDWEAKITILDSELNKHLFASNGSKNIQLNGYPDQGYDTFFISKTGRLPDPEVVPEPATVLLLAGGLLGGAFMRKKDSR